MDLLKNNLVSYKVPLIYNENIIRLNLNECSFSDNEKSTYNLNKNLHQKFIKSIADYNRVNTSNILVNFGSSEVLRILIHCISFSRKTNKVYGIIIPPTYSMLYTLMSMHNINKIETHFENIQTIIDEYNSETIFVYIDRPNNPTGYMHKYSEIKSLVDKNKNILFIIDEAYIDFTVEKSCLDFVNDFNNVVIVRTMSKGFQMADYRIGYLVSNKNNVENISNFSNPLSITKESMLQTIEALTNKLPQFKKDFKMVMNNRERFGISCRALPHVTKVIIGHGNFVIVEFDNTINVIDLIKKLEDNNIFVRRKPDNCNSIRVTISTINIMHLLYTKLQIILNHDKSNVYDGIILAAGMATRFKNGNNKIMTKCMINLEDEPLLVKKIKLMIKYVETIYIVIGADGEYVKNVLNELIDEKTKKRIVYIYNKFYSKYNNWYSFLLGLEAVNKDRDIIVNEGDAIFNKNLVNLVSKSSKNVFVCQKRELDDCEMKVIYNDEKITEMSKNTKDYDNIYGDYIGLARVSKDNIIPMIQQLKLASINDYYESIIVKAAPFQIMDTMIYSFINMNTQNDYKNVLKLFNINDL